MTSPSLLWRFSVPGALALWLPAPVVAQIAGPFSTVETDAQAGESPSRLSINT